MFPKKSSYTINANLHDYADKRKLHKIFIRLIYNRHIIKVPTSYKVLDSQFDNGQVINHPNKVSINSNIRNEITDIETRLTDRLRINKIIDKNELSIIANNTVQVQAKVKFVDFINGHNNETKGKKAENTVRIYNSLIPELEKYAPGLTFDQINVEWLNYYEQHLRSSGGGRLKENLDPNTIHKTMSRIKTLLNRAADKDLIEEKAYKKYKVPPYIQKIPNYLTEIEMQNIKNLIDNIIDPKDKMAGFYLLLSCYAGYRLGDLKGFKFGEFVKPERIVLDAQKNKAIVSMPIHTRLSDVLKYVEYNPLTLGDADFRIRVKKICSMCGIDRKIKIHTGRHSFAMMLMDNDFQMEDVAAMLGNTLRSTAIYARVSDKRIAKKVNEKLG